MTEAGTIAVAVKTLCLTQVRLPDTTREALNFPMRPAKLRPGI